MKSKLKRGVLEMHARSRQPMPVLKGFVENNATPCATRFASPARASVAVAVTAMLALALVGSASASACTRVTVKVHAKHWVWHKKTRTVHGHRKIVRVHGKIVYVHVRVTYLKTKHKLVCSTTPTTPAATPVIALAAHLDSTFTQNPTNPLAVTYTYSASATETINGTSNSDPDLPSGILNLYSDGILACSINVGGSVTGSQCSVTYPNVGAHTVIVTYEAGELSNTVTVIEQIEPFATTTHMVLREIEGEPGGLEVTPVVVGQGGNEIPWTELQVGVVISCEKGQVEVRPYKSFVIVWSHESVAKICFGQEISIMAQYFGGDGYAPSISETTHHVWGHM
jgi:hypothetical protein